MDRAKIETVVGWAVVVVAFLYGVGSDPEFLPMLMLIGPLGYFVWWCWKHMPERYDRDDDIDY